MKMRTFSVFVLLVGPILILLVAGCDRTEAGTDWPYPRYDLANTAANTTIQCELLEQPVESWQVTFPEGYVLDSLFPVAADIDSDGRAEYLIGAWNQTPEYRLYAFNIEDGSILWRRYFDDWFYWSAPIIVDVNNDSRLDIVLATKSQVMALNGNDASPIWVQPFPDHGMGMMVADVNNDGWVEVVINDYGDPQSIHLLNGLDGSPIWRRETGGSAYNIPTVGDVNGDGHPEILSHNHLYDPSRERLLVWDQDGNELWAYLASPSAQQEANAPPELGWVPDFGYISTTIADFNADGQVEIGWGTRCHYYVLNRHGDLLWRVPTVEGYGVVVSHRADGTVEPDKHGTGGPHGEAAGVGNLDADPSLEVALSFGPEYRLDWYENTGDWVYTYTQVTPANEVQVFSGDDGTLQWVFEGEYLSESKLENMGEPILVDLTADGLLDVLVLSTDRHLYAIQGSTGEQLMAYRVGPEDVPLFWVAHHLTFVVDGTNGVVLYGTGDDTTQPPVSTLHALQVARDCQ